MVSATCTKNLAVSIHTPARGVTALRAAHRAPAPCFNPHSRTGSDLQGHQIRSIHHQVSIHTPARGVTCLNFYLGLRIGVSIHTPARGVTFHKKKLDVYHYVSIHTPARGVT